MLRNELKSDINALAGEMAFKSSVQYLQQFNVNKDFGFVSLAYMMAAHSLKNNLIANRTDLIDAIMDIMKGCLFHAYANDTWDKVFDEMVLSDIDKDYFAILAIAANANKDLIVKIEQIRLCRICKTIPDELLNELMQKYGG